MSTATIEPAGQVLVGRIEAARMLSVSARTLHTMTQGGEIPFVRVRSRVLYRVEALREWAAKQERGGK